jgi:hypothetical protein
VPFGVRPQAASPKTWHTNEPQTNKQIHSHTHKHANTHTAPACPPPPPQTGAYIGRSLDGVPLEIDPAALQGFADHYSAAYDYYDSLLAGQGAASVHRVWYEDLCGAGGGGGGGGGAAEAFSRLCAFLGVDAAAPARPLDVTVRQTRAPLAGGILNYSDLEFAFRHTRLAGCFAG